MATLQTSPPPPTTAVVRRKARRKNRAVPTLAVLAVAALAGWWGWAKTHPAQDPAANLITGQVTRGDLLETVTATGSVTAQTGAQVKIGSQITGVIKRLYADVGTHVNAGQIIAELDLPDIEAQLKQAQDNLAAAQTKYQQQISGKAMEQTQTSGAVQQSQAAVRSAQAKLAAAEAASRMQTAQTPTSIKRAETALAAAKAALSTAQATQKQTQAGANLQIATAQEQLTQAKANETNSALNLERNQQLLAKGFVAKSVVDAAQATETVNSSLVSSAQQNLQLVKDKVAADVQTANDQVTQAQQNVQSAQAALVAAKAGTYQDAQMLAQVNDARAQVNQAKTNLLVAEGNVAQNVLKDQDIAQAKSAMEAAQQQVNYYRAQVNKTFIRSPISGTVLQLASQQGETLAAGLSAPTLIIVADLNRLQVDAFVDETDIGKVKLGQEASMVVDAFPKKTFRGHITKIASGSTIQQGVVTYDVTISISDSKHRLKPDMTTEVTINTGKKTNVLLVPAEAVKVGTHGSTVSVVTMKDGKKDVEPRRIRTGASDGINTEVLDGLKEGETIVLAGQDDGRRRWGSANPFGPSSKKGGKGGGKKG
jgi:RND family efflux transporter MFP subunit